MLFPYFDREFSSFFLLYLSLSYFSLYVYDLELLVRNFLIILRVYLILQVLQVVSVLGLRGFFFENFLWSFSAEGRGIFSPKTCKFLFKVYLFSMETRVST